MKLFVIDDDPIAIELLNGVLSHLGYSNVDSASDGKLALRILASSELFYDCILMDISMPDLSGIELCRLLCSDTKYSSVPIIMMTALRDQESVNNAFRAGATDYLNKPIDIVELEMRLRMVNNVNRKRRENLRNAVEYPSLQPRANEYVEKINLNSVKDLIDYSALCNYLAHLSLAGLETRQVIAAQLQEYENICSRASSEELSYILTEIADIVSNAFQEYDCFMSYFGDGAFIVVTEKSDLRSSIKLEERITLDLMKRGLEFDDGQHLHPEVSIGNPIRPNTSKTKRVRNTFDRAVARARSCMRRKVIKEISTQSIVVPGRQLKVL